MQELITANRDRIAELCRKHHVRRLDVFGSAVRGDFDPSTSDVDLLVEFEPVPEDGYARNYFSLLFSFDELFAREVDLIADASVRNPHLRQAIDHDRVNLYAA